ncbi:hypothetical protein ACFYVL_19635 [Streptomyces sp. NPDC004111]|uniref:hypothetical protein n=1 Tax=Streptomyces sp. NPDC004111 TaxID=3364690 RepID=UPI0036AFAA5F
MSETLTDPAQAGPQTTVPAQGGPVGSGKHRGDAAPKEEPTAPAQGRHRRDA